MGSVDVQRAARLLREPPPTSRDDTLEPAGERLPAWKELAGFGMRPLQRGSSALFANKG
ncbi:MAG: hypothetical protein M3Z08_04725 [Chloroflexota bacterium]|nr:hypothetical protein [Chloroflexota bacterium]